jgi:2-polyprenyl-6-methoxyphenol hydroxylase-like FAD-dependent oxidoreductase
VRILVVGAGVAGLTVASRLAAAGDDVRVVEREPAVGDAGYAIGLYPLGSRVVESMGLGAALEERSCTVDRYRLADVADDPIQSFDMSALTAAVGPMRMIERAALLELLGRGARGLVTRGVCVRSLLDDGASVAVSFTDGHSDRFDAVVGCDGIASPMRERVFGRAPVYDAGWELWTWWTSGARFDRATVREWWGARCFAGVYPAPARVMCAVGGPTEIVRSGAAAEILAREAPTLLRRVPALADALADAGGAYRWPMRDVRSPRWVCGRVALCGDSAAGFLSTAGFGASVALRSAWALTDELAKAGSTAVSVGLARYERRCRPIAERSQTDSRRLARVMFLRHGVLDRPRRALARHYPPARALGQIVDANRVPF